MAVTAAPSPSMTTGRARPALAFLLCAVFIAAHHWWVVTHQEMYPKLLLFLFMVGGWSFGGLLHPPAFHSLTNHGKHLPKSSKVLGSLFMAAGFALGFYVMLNLYE